MREEYSLRFSRNCYYVCLGIIAVLAVLYIVLLILDIPLTKIYPYPCTLYAATNLYCPGCGGTRALAYLLKGNLIKSFIYHPVILYTAVLVGCYVITHTLNIFTKGKIKAMGFRPVYFYIMVAIILLQCIIKNVLVICAGIHLI